jgi:hypothetical protein
MSEFEDVKNTAEGVIHLESGAPISSKYESTFSLFARIDKNKDRKIDVFELKDAIEEDSDLKERLCFAARLSAHRSSKDLAFAIMKAAKKEVDGTLTSADFEALLRHWDSKEWTNVENREERETENRMKGAAARSEINVADAGGFRGITDRKEALEIGIKAIEITKEQRRLVVKESEPEIFPNGAIYQTDDNAKAERDAREREIREQEQKDLNLKEFHGLTKEEATKVVHDIKFGGEVVEVADDAPKNHIPKGLAERLSAHH